MTLEAAPSGAALDDLNCPPSMGRAMARRIPGAQLVELEGAGHLVLFEQAPRLLGAAMGASSLRGAGSPSSERSRA